MREPEKYQVFDELVELPAHLQPKLWWKIALLLAGLAGIGLGLAHDTQVQAERVTRCVFFGSAFLYLYLSMTDFYEHFRIEKQLTGRYTSAQFIPVGETINHALTSTTVVLMFVLSRPLRAPLETRDLVFLALPGIFLILGLRDEFVYHRRRSYHREDIIHTSSHLCAGIMVASYYMASAVDWSQFSQ